ncbi:glycosyltransferase family 4 protein [Streptococcus suis]|uniref:Glycosyltransferase family 4 protein n=2 Tax=Streptococcus TaxID=1301 RepID=A0A4T2GSQ8_STRSU|nr:glycosyltransferase family 4 protein [Streptococcus suis]
MVMRDKIVISGINLFEGGPLSIYYDCLNEFIRKDIHLKKEIIAFVHRIDLFEEYKDYVTLIEFPKSRGSYLKRLWYEYVYFYYFSKKNKVDMWISLHDITPNVKANKIYTYCHNPSPFLKKSIKNFRYSITNSLFSLFYKYLYRINIKAATAIIVQQDWMRNRFLEMYPIKNVIVAYPEFEVEQDFNFIDRHNKEKPVWIYPAFPRFFKNYEVIGEAVKNIEDLDFEVLFTIDGTENSYSRMVFEKYRHLSQIKWLGKKSRKEIFQLYEEASGLIFPSKLETWGLPISEFKRTKKDIILSDLPYAHETLGTYSKALFFNPDNGTELSTILRSIIDGNPEYSNVVAKEILQPFSKGWSELVDLLLSD